MKSFLSVMLLVTVVRGDISEKLRQGQGFNPVRQTHVGGLQPPFPVSGVKGGAFPSVQNGAANQQGRFTFPVQHGVDEDEHNLNRLCNDPFHSFLCSPVGPRNHRIDGRLRPGAVIPTGVGLNYASTNIRETKQQPLLTGSALLPTSLENEGYQYPSPTNTFAFAQQAQQAGYFYTKPPVNHQFNLPEPQQSVQSNIKFNGYQYNKPPNQLAFPSAQITTKTPPVISNEYLPALGSPAPSPTNDKLFPPFQTSANQNYFQFPTSSKQIQQSSFTTTQKKLANSAFSYGSTIKPTYPASYSPPQYYYNYSKPTQPPITFRPTTTTQKYTTTTKIYKAPSLPSSTLSPLLIPNEFGPSNISPVVKPKDFSNQKGYQYQNPTNLFPSTSKPFTTKAPVKFSSTKLSNEYLPPNTNTKARPAQNVGLGINFSQNLQKNIPNPTNQFPVITKPIARPSNEYLPANEAQSTNISPNVEGGALLAAQAEPAGANKSPPLQKTERTHTLEELCNDAFHSFLCKPITKPRKRIDGRIRPGAKIPPHVLESIASNQNSAQQPPPAKEGTALLSSGLPNQQQIAGYPYYKPQGSPFQSTNINPTVVSFHQMEPSTYFLSAASDTASLAKKFNGQFQQASAQNISENVIQPVTPTNPSPTTTQETLANTGNKGYFYPKPSESSKFTYPTKKPEGYTYTKPPTGLEFTLPNLKPVTSTTKPPFGTRLSLVNKSQIPGQEEIRFPQEPRQNNIDVRNEDDQLPPASQFEILKP